MLSFPRSRDKKVIIFLILDFILRIYTLAKRFFVDGIIGSWCWEGLVSGRFIFTLKGKLSTRFFKACKAYFTNISFRVYDCRRWSLFDGVRYLIETLLRNDQWEHVLLRQAARPKSVDYGIVVNGSPSLVPSILISLVVMTFICPNISYESRWRIDWDNLLLVQFCSRPLIP